MENFQDWLTAEMKERGWKPADLARESGMSQTQISNVLNNERKPGTDFCQGIARAFGLVERVVFVKAGLMHDDEAPPVAKNKLLAELLSEPERREMPVTKTHSLGRVRFGGAGRP